jgi:hypothetical protein
VTSVINHLAPSSTTSSLALSFDNRDTSIAQLSLENTYQSLKD